MILLKKDIDQLMDESLVEAKGMGLTEEDAGGVVRLLLYLFNKRLAAYYETFDLNMTQALVSNASDFYLEKIGRLVDCTRQNGEDTEAFRYRMTKQIQIVASSNYTAVRLAILSVEGVQEVKLKRFTHGTGSFSAYIVSEDPITPQAILDEVNAKINMGVEGYGIRAEAFRPVIKPIELKIRLIFSNTVTDLDKQLATAQAQEAVKTYINSRNVEESIIIEDIRKLIQAINPGISEIIFFYFKISNRPVVVTDQSCAWNERFVESDKANAIQVI
jgi:hypothetical protein